MALDSEVELGVLALLVLELEELALVVEPSEDSEVDDSDDDREVEVSSVTVEELSELELELLEVLSLTVESEEVESELEELLLEELEELEELLCSVTPVRLPHTAAPSAPSLQMNIWSSVRTAIAPSRKGLPIPAVSSWSQLGVGLV